MTEWLTNLWGKNKILFWILCPLVALAFVAKFMLDSNYQGAVDDVNSAQQVDSELAQQQSAAESAANIHKENADKIENEIENNNNSLEGENWHEK